MLKLLQEVRTIKTFLKKKKMLIIHSPKKRLHEIKSFCTLKKILQSNMTAFRVGAALVQTGSQNLPYVKNYKN